MNLSYIVSSAGQEATGLTLAALAGLLFSLVAIAYKLGHQRGVTVMHIVLVMSTCGTIVYGGMSLALPLSQAPAIVWVFGLMVGPGQYVLTRLIRPALDRGSVSVLWCALSLAFLPMFAYVYAVFGKGLNVYGFASVASAIACVVVASASNPPDPNPLHRARSGLANHMVYLALLVAILLLNGLGMIAQYDLGHRYLPDGRSLLDGFGSLYYALLYGLLGLGALIELGWKRTLMAHPRRTLWLGAMASVGSVTGMYLIGVSTEYGDSIVYPIQGVVGIAATAMASAFMFREKRTVPWYAALVLAALAVVLGNVKR